MLFPSFDVACRRLRRKKERRVAVAVPLEEYPFIAIMLGSSSA